MKVFNLTNFNDAEPDFNASPVKVGKQWLPPGSFVSYPGGKVGRIITTKSADKVPTAEKERSLKGDVCIKLNIFTSGKIWNPRSRSTYDDVDVHL